MTYQQEAAVREHYRTIVENMSESEQFDLLPTDVQDKLRDEWPETLDRGDIFEVAHAMVECDLGPCVRFERMWLSFLESQKLFENYAERMVDQLISDYGDDL